MTNLDQTTLTPRDQQVLNLLAQGCSNKEIGGELSISSGTVKNHLRILFCRARIFDGRKRVKLARYVHERGSADMTSCADLNPMERQISVLVWEGLTNRQIGKIVGTSEQMIKNHLHRAFDKLGVWSRLELAMYMANHGGKEPDSRDLGS
jgi:DNA-binding NarL/FixJ family response regulator